MEGLRSQNLAVAGSATTLDALRWDEVDTLIMASDYQPDPAWTCTACRAVGTEAPETSVCPQCGEPAVRPLLRLDAMSQEVITADPGIGYSPGCTGNTGVPSPRRAHRR